MKNKLFLLLAVLVASYSSAQTRDSIGKVKHDTTYKVEHDSIFKVPLIITPSLVAAQYDNGTTAWFFTAQGQDAMIKWHLSIGDNRIYLYNLGGSLKDNTKWKWFSRFNDSCSVHGIMTGFPYSNYTQITIDLDKFHKSVTKQSSKFDIVISEIEAYNNAVSYAVFWEYIRKAKQYADANGIIAIVYEGWNSQQSKDSIYKYCHEVALHCYIASDRMGNPSYEYGYTRSRMEMYVNSVNVVDPLRKVKISIIFSNEPDFGYAYYVSNKLNLKAPYTAYQTGFSLYATTAVKSKVELIGYTTFVSSNSTKISPVMGLTVSMLRMKPEIRTKKLLYVNPETMKTKIIEVDLNLYNQTKSLE